MRFSLLRFLTLLALLGLTSTVLAQAPDSSPHTARFVTVDSGVRLEVLDWGGSGRAVVLLAGLGNTAHVFDQIAPKLATNYHVFGITRRGFGASSAAASGYDSDRLGDDVLAVIDSLRLDAPVLIGHSIAGEELSSVASRHPDRIGGLVYLEAGYAYAFYDRARGDFSVDLAELRRKLDGFLGVGVAGPAATTSLIRELLDTDLLVFARELRDTQRALASTRIAAPGTAPAFVRIAMQIVGGERRYTAIDTPALAVYALPHRRPAAIASDPAIRAAAEALDSATAVQADAFEKGVPAARVVRVPNATHYIYISNEADVLGEIRAFVDKLPNPGRRADVEELDLSTVGRSPTWKIAGRTVAMATVEGRRALRISDGPGIGMVWLDGYDLGDGVIDVDLLGRSEPDGGSFVGVAFRVADAGTHDAVFFRPFNFRAADSARHAHAVQYVSHPTWTWNRLRTERPGQYEKPLAPGPDGDAWFHARIVLDGRRVSTYVNGAREPSLVVDALSDRAHGSIGLWVGNGSGGSFANLRVTHR
jgi:non-heme chloroperoxidase